MGAYGEQRRGKSQKDAAKIKVFRETIEHLIFPVVLLHDISMHILLFVFLNVLVSGWWLFFSHIY